MGFDIDSCCAAYDGTRLLCLPRFRRAVNSSLNLVDPSRRSPSYESRLRKYALRGFAVSVPGYDPSRVVASVFFPDGDIGQTEGLARLLLHAQEDAKHPAHVPRPFQQLPSTLAGLDGDVVESSQKLKPINLESPLSGYMKSDEPYLLDFAPNADLKYVWPWSEGGPIASINKYLKHSVSNLEVGAKLTFIATTSIGKALKWPKDQSVTYLVQNSSDSDNRYRRERIEAIATELEAKKFTMTVPSTVEFITQDPGRQYVTGSFEPEDRDWYASAYGELPADG